LRAFAVLKNGHGSMLYFVCGGAKLAKLSAIWTHYTVIIKCNFLQSFTTSFFSRKAGNIPKICNENIHLCIE
jgi:hypothetical protein